MITDPYTKFLRNAPEYPRFRVAGEAAVLVELGDGIDAELNAQVLRLDRLLQSAARAGVVETVPAYRSLLVVFDPDVQTHDGMMDVIDATLRYGTDAGGPLAMAREWTIPVVYGGADGFDLGHVARHCGLAEDEVVRRHSAATYRVYMIGFNPGFPYLGGLPQELAIPRRAVPTPHVEPGRLIIGGGQAAITSVPTPTGWYVIGSTPVRAFDLARRQDPFLFRAGDLIRFRPISQDDHARLSASETGGAELREEIGA